jgi:site-specific DNA-methyltransferase (adenine-specific)
VSQRFILHPGDCLKVLDTLDENSVDAVVTDAPYHLTSIVKRFGAESAAPAKDYTGEKAGATGAYARASRGFMGKTWDGGDIAFRPETWAKVLRVLKPGGHLIAFGGTRTYHRLGCAIEDAGFEIREMHAWVFGSGFPKSLDVSKAIDKAAGFEGDGGPFTYDAREWEGWGTATKPAMEPVCLARKPLSEKTVAANVLRWGVGALNIDATRIETTDNLNGGAYAETGGRKESPSLHAGSGMNVAGKVVGKEFRPPSGRWPANLYHDGSDEVLALFPQSRGQQGDVRGTEKSRTGDENTVCYGEYGRVAFSKRSDSGSAARFFYQAKASKADRFESRHPTVKPVALMRWLVRLVTPPGGTVLDPFAGTGTTGQAAIEEGFKAILIEQEEEYRTDILRRMNTVLVEHDADWPF